MWAARDQISVAGCCFAAGLASIAVWSAGLPGMYSRCSCSSYAVAQVGGNWLAWWIILAAAASQIGQFQAEMSSDSYQLQGMAERGFLPKALASRSKHGTPTYGILLSSLGVMGLASFSFVDIVELLNAIYCLAELLEFAAYIWLRIRAPNLPRPYK
jgi:amino acid transporter